MKIAVTGATGFVGRLICAVARGRGHEVIRLSRGPQGDRRWDPMTHPAPLEGADAVIHLAGEPLTEGRWTRAKLDRIRRSRVIGTRNLVAGLRFARPRVLLSASAVGVYGDRGEEELTEGSPAGDGFLAGVCRDWEAEAKAAGIRTVLVRTATVLGPGGALAKMRGPFRLGLGGTLGDGRQWMSWIHREDLADLYFHALNHPEITGPIVAASPNPVRSADFTRTLARVLDRPALFPIPRWGLRLVFGRVATVLTASQRCHPTKALETGFRFSYPTLDAALLEAVNSFQARVEKVA
ncbi:MAG TPA: TIGR01777 family oxidoreductase [Planctomycetota bacterium]|nr:TIGR01777 family oxidoreductase [Planctomycetota bacterium]